jgi:hypothetical protein
VTPEQAELFMAWEAAQRPGPLPLEQAKVLERHCVPGTWQLTPDATILLLDAWDELDQIVEVTPQGLEDGDHYIGGIPYV